MEQRLSSIRLIGFSIGSIGTGLFSTTPTVLLLFYMTQILGISGALAGTALLVPKLWDMVTDPIVGVLSDRTRTRIGRRKPYLIAGALLMPVCLVAMFSVPVGFSRDAAFWYVLGVYFVSATAYSLFSVPYITIPAELSSNPNERARIMSYRTAFVMFGVLIGSALPPYLVYEFGGGRDAYVMAGAVLASICLIAMLIAVVSLTGVTLLEPDTNTPKPHQVISAVLTPVFLWLAVTHVLQIVAVGIVLTSAAYIATFVFLSDSSLAGDFLTATFGVAILAMPVWTIAVIKFGRVVAFGIGALIYGVCALSISILGVGNDTSVFLGIGAGMGVAFAAVQMIPYALLTDTIHAHGQRHGFGSEGIFTGVWTALEKLGLALAPFIFGVGLDIAGFVEGQESEYQPENLPQAVLSLGAGVPALFIFASFFSLYKFARAFEYEGRNQ